MSLSQLPIKSPSDWTQTNHQKPHQDTETMIYAQLLFGDKTTSLLERFPGAGSGEPCKYAWEINYTKMLHKFQFAINQNIIGHIKFA